MSIHAASGAASCTARAEVPTASASKYLQQLCKHFGHKVETTYNAHEGRIAFPAGACTLLADAASLRLHVSSADNEALARLKHVLESHLLRFAFREELHVNWLDDA